MTFDAEEARRLANETLKSHGETFCSELLKLIQFHARQGTTMLEWSTGPWEPTGFPRNEKDEQVPPPNAIQMDYLKALGFKVCHERNGNRHYGFNTVVGW